MPEYLAPAVYVEETSFRSKSIEGVSTSTTGMVGPTLTGPSSGTPELLTSFADFQRLYGGYDNLQFTSQSPSLNYLAHAVRAFFNEGGSRLYVARVLPSGTGTAASADVVTSKMKFVARFPGRLGNGRVSITAKKSPANVSAMGRAPVGSVVLSSSPLKAVLKTAGGWKDNTNATFTLPAGEFDAVGDFITLTVQTTDAFGRELSYEGLGLDPSHPQWIGNVLSEQPSQLSEALQRQFAVQMGGTLPTGLEVYDALFYNSNNSTHDTTAEYNLTGGLDGAEPTDTQYETALDILSSVEDVSIVAAPGSSAYGAAKAIRGKLITHAEKPRAYRIAVLDTPKGQTPTHARAWRGEIDSTRAALYYPWVVVANPLARPGDDSTPKEIALPPSGFLCGVYARNDAEKGVFKAPANETVRSALRFEVDINHAQQEVLNPLGINCLRFFPGRGYRVWGARTASSDPEWKYVNIRRYFNYLERSIDNGTQWAVFEPNGERLWANIRETLGSFLENEWRSGALLGTDPKQAFFVRCDRSTMSQNDLDNGRLICLVGVAAVKPAEFVIFRIGQKTADARN